MRFGIRTAVTIRIMTFRDVTQCVLVDSLTVWYLHILGCAASYRIEQQS